MTANTVDWQAEVERRLLVGDSAPDRDVVEELGQHAAEAYAAERDAGAAPDAAYRHVGELLDAWCAEASVRRRRARRAQPVPPPAGTARLAGLGLDLAYGLRLLRRQPGHALLAATTIALAVGAVTTLASVAYGVLARPLPWPAADRLVRIHEVREGGHDRGVLTNVAYHSWLEGTTTLEALAGYSAPTVTLDAGDGPVRVPGAYVTASLFDVLRPTPLRGRLLVPEDETARDVVLLSEGTWQRRFGGATDVVGRTVTVDGERLTVAGVLPDGFGFPERATALWMPFQVAPLATGGEQTSLDMFRAVGRLRPDASATAAAAEATAAVRNGPSIGLVETAVFGSSGPAEVRVVPLHDAMTAEVRPALAVLLAGVLLLFATAVGGIATMQVARAVARRREIALRAAIGAGSGRIARQLLLEHLVVGLAGGLGGFALAGALHVAIPHLLPADFPRVDDIRLDWRVAAGAAVLAVAAGLVTALVPVLQTRRLDLVSALTDGGLAPNGARLRTPVTRLRAAAMVGQVAITAVLLVGAGLVGSSFLALVEADRGYDPAHLLTANLALGEDAVAHTARLDTLVERLRAVPGVRHAAHGDSVPLMSGSRTMLGFRIDPAETGTSEPIAGQADLVAVGTGYVEALGLRLAAGRSFTAADGAAAEPVLLVNRAFERRYLPGGAVGARLPLGIVEGRPEWRIVGVLENVVRPSAGEPPPPRIYAPASQVVAGLGITEAKLVIRTDGPPREVVAALRTLARDVVPAAPLDSVMTMRDRVAGTLARPRLYAILLIGFSAFALLIAAVGLFAVLSHGVAERRREMGVRLALGATPRGVVALVLRDGARLALAGTALGLAIAWGLARYVETLLYGIAPRDPLVFAAAGVVVAVVACLACGAPALRAARVDPVRTLRAG